MRTIVRFEYPAPFVGTEEDNGGVLSVKGAGWFAVLLGSIPELVVDPDLCQEDWGVVVFAMRGKMRFDFFFWDGLAEEPRRSWVAELRHGGFFDRFMAKKREGLDRLVGELDRALKHDPSVSRVEWFDDSDKPFDPAERGFPAPA